VITADTSVAVAAALPWHEAHTAARSALSRRKPRLIAHVAVETYSVLTRLPPPQRVPAPVAWTFLREVFASPPLVLAPKRYVELIQLAAAKGIVGGAVYDAVVAATAGDAGAELLTLDERAARAYELVGVHYVLVR
jgi:predicted nucleic acid-binding protein